MRSLLLICIVLSLSFSVIHAQEAPPIITPENAAQLTLVASIPAAAVNFMDWTPDSQYLITPNYSEGAFWELPTLARAALTATATDYVNGLAVSPTRPEIFLTSQNGEVVGWNYMTQQALFRFQPSRSSYGAAVSADGNLLAFASSYEDSSSAIQIYDIQSGEPFQFYDIQSGEPFQFYEGLTGNQLAFSPDGRWLAVGWGQGGLRLLDITRQQVPYRITHEEIYGLAFSADSQFLYFLGKRGLVHVWEVASRRDMTHFRTGNGNAHGFALHPSGKLIATTSAITNVLEIWDLENQRLLKTFTGSEIGSAVSFSPDGRYLAAGGFTLLLYTVAN